MRLERLYSSVRQVLPCRPLSYNAWVHTLILPQIGTDFNTYFGREGLRSGHLCHCLGEPRRSRPDCSFPLIPLPLIVSLRFLWSGSDRGPAQTAGVGIWPSEGALAEETPGTQARLGCPAPLL